LAKNIENTEVWATDISEKALKNAKKNAVRNNVKIFFLHHDILQCTNSLPDNFELIVSNPPYIPLSERIHLPKNVVNYEPENALFVPDENPLIFYVAIAEMAKKILRKGGELYFETHENFAFDVCEMLSQKEFKEIEVWNDMNGKSRFVNAKKL
jgi:release factor glutamine methyltransferase